MLNNIITMKISNIFTFALAVFSPLINSIPISHDKHVVHSHHLHNPRYSHCPISFIQSQEKIVKEKCCLGKVCNTAPKTCSKECAVVFMPFYKKCKRVLDHSFYNVHYSTSPTNKRKLQQRPTRTHSKTHPRTHSRTHSKTYSKTHHHIHIPNRRCMDKWGTSCSILKRLNDCKTGKMASAMKMGCAKTCGACRQQSNIHIMSQRCSKIYNEEVLNKKHYKNTKIPTTCTLWNNGCNNCGVNKGKLTFCTKMMCIRKQKPRCLKYKGISVVSKKPISKCDEIAFSNVLKGCERILRTDLRKMNKKKCKTTCVKNMVKFYNKCYDAPSLKNFFKTLDIAIIKPCEEGIKFIPIKSPAPSPATAIGRTRDSHNCLLTAGYTWCGPSKKCVRKWITHCPQK